MPPSWYLPQVAFIFVAIWCVISAPVTYASSKVESAVPTPTPLTVSATPTWLTDTAGTVTQTDAGEREDYVIATPGDGILSVVCASTSGVSAVVSSCTAPVTTGGVDIPISRNALGKYNTPPDRARYPSYIYQ
ncbi:hypothetical protein KIPB_016244 [Kipferlia bialata]|uniref:Uncharacterized protein n=1 Tax=Kipferlia bialata TaxID=797122 RepID=A0A9K3GRV8_9EUKA|nr:hypothetical protein KIPB_016244 [Kipferlia bialata]|eukprot:g16244.t1